MLHLDANWNRSVWSSLFNASACVYWRKSHLITQTAKLFMNWLQVPVNYSIYQNIMRLHWALYESKLSSSSQQLELQHMLMPKCHQKEYWWFCNWSNRGSFSWKVKSKARFFWISARNLCFHVCSQWLLQFQLKYTEFPLQFVGDLKVECWQGKQGALVQNKGENLKLVYTNQIFNRQWILNWFSQ